MIRHSIIWEFVSVTKVFRIQYEMLLYGGEGLALPRTTRFVLFEASDRFSLGFFLLSTAKTRQHVDFIYRFSRIENYSKATKRKHRGESFELHHLYFVVISIWMWTKRNDTNKRNYEMIGNSIPGAAIYIYTHPHSNFPCGNLLFSFRCDVHLFG